jgi:predicted DNA-binding transcriptional regulator AlpA
LGDQSGMPGKMFWNALSKLKVTSDMENDFLLISERRLIEILQKHFSVKNTATPSSLRTEQSDDILTLDDVVGLTGYAKQTIYAFIGAKSIPFYKKGKKLFFSRVEIENWIKAGNGKGAAK